MLVIHPGLFKDRHRRFPPLPCDARNGERPVPAPVVPSVVGPVEEGQTDMMPARGGSTYSRGGAFEVGFER